MRSFKRLFSLLLIAALMLGIVPMTAFAQKNFAFGADSAEILYAGGRQADGFFVGQNGKLYESPDTLIFDGQAAKQDLHHHKGQQR